MQHERRRLRQPPAGDARDLEHRRAGRPRRPRIELRDGAAHHPLHDLGVGERPDGAAADRGAVADHRHAIRERPHLLEHVRDEHDRVSLPSEPLHKRFKMPHVLARQAARRLVEHEHAAADRHRPGDLHHLPVGDRQPRHDRIGRNVGPTQLAERRPCRLAARGRADESGQRRLDAEQDVVGDGEMRGEGELLMDHRHTGGPRVAGRPGLVGSAVEQHRPGVGPDHAGEHLHERALARAVFAHQREHLAAGHAQVHAR